MQCPQCQSNYQTENHIPRILIACGHTICEKCISASFSKQSLVNQSKYCFECPECHTKNEAESVMSFPKNIALISMSSAQSQQQQPSNQSIPQRDKPHTSIQLSNVQKGSQQSSKRQGQASSQGSFNRQQQKQQECIGICKQHDKKIEAYCSNDKQILCIDCILSDTHKNHEIASVQKAVETERDNLTIKFKASQELEFSLEELNKNIDSHCEMLKDQARKNTTEIQTLFQEVRAMIDEKEAQTVENFKQILKHEETYLDEKKQSNHQQIEVVRQFQDEWMKLGQEEDIQQLNKMKERYELADQALVTVSKTNFNHVFTDVKRETEVLNISKMLKASKPKDSNKNSFSNNNNNGGTSTTTTTPASVGSNYMQGTHSWQNKNKATTAQQPPLQSQTSQSQRANKVGTSAIRSSSKDRRQVAPNTKTVKGKQRSPAKDLGSSTSFNLAGCFNSNDLIAGFSSQQAPTPSANKSKVQDLVSAQAFRNLNSQSSTGNHQPKPESKGGNFDDFSRAFKSGPGITTTTAVNPSQGNATPQQQSTKEQPQRKVNILPAAPSSHNANIQQNLPNVSPRPKTTSCYVPRSDLSQTTGNVVQKLGAQSKNNPNNQSQENLLLKAATIAVGSKQPANLAEMRNKMKSQKNNALQSALQTQEDNINMLQRYKTQIDSEKCAREEQDSTSCNTSSRQSEQSSRDVIDKKQELLQKALGLTDKENNGVKNAKQQQKKKYLNQGSEVPKTSGKITTTVCHVNLVNENVPFEPASDIKKKNSEDSQHHHEQLSSSKHVIVQDNNHQQDSFRENMSITKSMVDLYHQNKYNQKVSAADDLMSLYRHETQYIYVISGFCDNSLGYVERLNVDNLEWEELMPVKIPRTKFTVVQGQKPHEIMILGGKDQDGQRSDTVETYNCYDNIWSIVPDVKLRKPRSGFAAISLKSENKVIIIGGNDGRVQNRVECLNLTTKQWVKIAKMNMKRDELAACLGPDNKIYAIGGYGGGDNACLSSAERFDIEKGKWELIAPMKEARRALTAVALPDGIYAIGGYNGKEYVNTVERYDVFSNEWVSVKSMKQARCTLSAVASSDCQYIYAIGGFNGAPLNNVERYDVTKEEWEQTLPPMKQKRFMHSSIMDRQGYQRYDVNQLDIERIIKRQDRMYLIHLRSIIEASLFAYQILLNKFKLFFKQQIIITIKQLKQSLVIIDKYEREASSYMLFSKLDTSSYKRTDTSSTTIDSIPRERVKSSFRRHHRPLKFVMEEDPIQGIEDREISPDSFQFQQEEKQQMINEFQLQTHCSEIKLEQGAYNIEKQVHRKCQSIPNTDNLFSLKDMMKERLSGHEYEISPGSFVSYCSFDSYKSYARALLEYDQKIYQKDGFMIKDKFQQSDKGNYYRKRMLLMKGMLSLKIHMIKRRTQNRIERPKIHSKHPYYVVALIKSQFQSFNDYHSSNSRDMDHFQKKLWIIHKSLSSIFKRKAKPNVGYKFEQHQMLFNYKHRLMRQAMSRLVKLVNIQKKQRELNFKTMQLQLSKYQSVPLYHWIHLYKHRMTRARKMAKTLRKIVNKAIKPYYVQMVILLTNDMYSHKFIIERETFIYNLKKQELERKARYFNIKDEAAAEEEEKDLSEYLKDISVQQEVETEYTYIASPSSNLKQISTQKQFQSMDKLYQKYHKPQILTPKVIEVKIQKKMVNSNTGNRNMRVIEKSSMTSPKNFKINIQGVQMMKSNNTSVGKQRPPNTYSSLSKPFQQGFKFTPQSEMQSLRVSVTSHTMSNAINSSKTLKNASSLKSALSHQTTPKSDLKNSQQNMLASRKQSLNEKIVKELAKTQRVINIISKKQ